MAEQVFLDENEVRVTNSRFVVPGQTYAMANVTSVAARKDSPSRIVPALLTIIGFLVVLGGFSEDASIGITGLVILAAGVLWLWFRGPTYFVILNTASGESRALKSRDKEWIERIVETLIQAIVARG